MSVLGIDAVYVDSANSYIAFSVKVVKQDKSNLPAATDDVKVCFTHFLHIEPFNLKG